MPQERLHKLLAAAGIASRRECEEMILEGRVRVNGHVADTMPVLVDPEHDTITVDGERFRTEPRVYFVLHKPRGVLPFAPRSEGKRSAIGLLTGVRDSVQPVGRMDADTSGLLILTNDGGLAQRMAHARSQILSRYQVHIDGVPSSQDLEKLRAGVWLSEGKVRVSEVRLAFQDRRSSVLEIALIEGKNREIQRLMAKVGYKVRRLIRTQVDTLTLKGLPPGGFRRLTPQEIASLQEHAAHEHGPRSHAPRVRAPGSQRRRAPRPKGRPR